MKSKIKYLFLIGAILLSGCATNSESDNSHSSEIITSDIPSTSLEETSVPPLTSEDTTSIVSEEPTSEVPPSSEEVPLVDPDVTGLTRSVEWPSLALNAYLTYAKNMVMPMLTSRADFHHGRYEDENFLEFYRVLTRVKDSSGIHSYIEILTNDYDFTLTEEESNVYYGQSMYDDVRLYLEYKYTSDRHEVIFDFFDGNGDQYSGPVAIDNIATFDLTTREALTSKSPTVAKWEVRPATFSVYKRTSGYNVGNTNGDHLSNPLRIYPGQAAIFKVASTYHISEIAILAASGYAAETVDNGTFVDATATVNRDFVLIKPTTKTNEIEYTLAQVINVGQVRWLQIKVTIAKNV